MTKKPPVSRAVLDPVKTVVERQLKTIKERKGLMKG